MSTITNNIINKLKGQEAKRPVVPLVRWTIPEMMSIKKQLKTLKAAQGTQVGDPSPRIPGIYWNALQRKWTVKLGLDGNKEYLGVFLTFEDAVKAMVNRKQELGIWDN